MPYQFKSGQGLLERGQDRYGVKENGTECPTCFGSGKFKGESCADCGGHGKTSSKKNSHLEAFISKMKTKYGSSWKDKMTVDENYKYEETQEEEAEEGK